MESTSPKGDGSVTTVSLTTPTSANGKRLVQARLPFRTAAPTPGAAAITTTTVVTSVDKRKRKLSKTEKADDAERAAKLHRRDSDGGAVVASDLLSTEILDESVEYTMTDRKSMGKSEVKLVHSESKENVDVNERGVDEDLVELDDDSADEEVDQDLATPNAKKCLNMNGGKQPRSKRVSDENLFTIKLPTTKKAKHSSKKSKKVEKVEPEEPAAEAPAAPVVAVEIVSDDDTDEEKTSKSPSDSNILNESVCSSLGDNQIMCTPGSEKNMTPRQLARRAEYEKKMVEKQQAKDERERERRREKEEKEKQKQKEREAKEEQRKREKDAKEQKRLAELEEKEKKKQAELEEKERKRLAEIEAKNEERRRKEEQKEEERKRREEQKEEERKRREEQKEEERKKREEQKEEERKRREEEKRQREEAEANKHRKEAEALKKFFVPMKSDAKTSDADAKQKEDSPSVQQFMSFQIKGDMKVAAVTRRKLTSQQRANLEKALATTCGKSQLYLSKLKDGTYETQRDGKTWSTEEDAQSEADDDILYLDADGSQIEVISDKPKKRIFRAKFLLFHENRRPPYYGTWRKKSMKISPRRPFSEDKKQFDYEVDSDDEWEEEEPGESLHGSDDEEPVDDYEIDNELFVPHGHLSDEELNAEDELDDENSVNSLETQQAKLKYIQEAFESEQSKKTERLKPRVIGLIWQQADRTQPNNCTSAIWDLLQANAYMMAGSSVSLTPPASHDGNQSDDDGDSPKSSSTRRLQIGERDVPNLVRLINGNPNKIDFLVREFRAFMAKTQTSHREFSQISIRNKIKELAEFVKCPEQGSMFNRKCWYVSIEKRKRYGLEDVTLPNTWEYTLTPRRITLDTGAAAAAASATAAINPNGTLNDSLSQKDKVKDGDFIDLSDSNSCGLSEIVTSETIRQASSKKNCIGQWMRVLTEDEKKKQFGPLTLSSTGSDGNDSANESSSQPNQINGGASVSIETPPKPIAIKKRVKLLASCPIGKEFSPKLKETLVTQYIEQHSLKRKSSSDNANESRPSSDTPPIFTAADSTKSEKDAKRSGDVIVID